jgi:hypothetical protein
MAALLANQSAKESPSPSQCKIFVNLTSEPWRLSKDELIELVIQRNSRGQWPNPFRQGQPLAWRLWRSSDYEMLDTTMRCLDVTEPDATVEPFASTARIGVF